MTQFATRVTKINDELAVLKAGFSVEFTVTDKNNISLPSYILKDGSNVAPVVYPRPSWLNLSDREIALHLIEVYKSAAHTISLDNITSEYIYDNVCPMVVNSKNIKMLENLVTKDFLDMAIIFYVSIDENSRFKITKNMLHNYNLNEDRIYECALHNAEQNMSLSSMYDTLVELSNDELDGLIDCVKDNSDMYIISNTNRVWGAGTIASDKLLHKVTKLLGDEFYVLPSSVHECICMRMTDRLSVEDLKDMVVTINSNEVALEDQLTDSVYLYSVCEGLKVVA